MFLITGNVMTNCGWIMGGWLLLFCLLPQVVWTTSYKQGDPVMLYVNKVGPYHNPQETYHYYTLPVCRPKEVSFGLLWYFSFLTVSMQ